MADILVASGAAKQGGSWIEYGNDKYHGVDKFADFLREGKNLEKATKQVLSMVDRVNAFGVRKDDKSADAKPGSLEVGGDED